ARSSGVPATALAPSIPPTHAAALEPSPRLSGIACTHSIATPVNRRPAASKSVRAARATMLASVAGSWPRPSPRTETVTPSASASVSSLYRASASPSASKPGPRLAEVAGTRTRAIIGVPGARPPGLSVVEEGLDDRVGGLRVPRARADGEGGEVAAAVDQEARRQRAH